MKAQACIRAALTIVAATGALMGAAVAPATAAGPQRETFSFTEADTIDCSQFNPSWQFHDDFVDFLTSAGRFTSMPLVTSSGSSTTSSTTRMTSTA